MKDKITSLFKWQVNFNMKKIGIISMIIILMICLSFLIAICPKKVKLTCTEAEKIVLEKLQNGTMTKCELFGNKYEIEVSYKNFEYELIMDGNSGEILEYDVENID